MRFLAAVLLLLGGPALHAAERVELGPELWQLPRSGRMVSGLGPLRRIAADYDRDPRQRITIRHPGGDAGTAWAAEVRDWLVAMGIASSQVALLPGTGLPHDGLLIETVGP